MLRGTNVIGLPIFLKNEEINEHVIDWILDLQNNQLMGFIVQQGGWSGSARILLWENIIHISNQSLHVDYPSPIFEMGKMIKIKQLLEEVNDFIGLKVITKEGQSLGKVVDFLFDNSSGHLSELQLRNEAALNRKNIFMPILTPLNQMSSFIIATPEMTAAIYENHLPEA
ncbi:PRC-barrel domain-containing protein [Phototrophicus methaneseepsis]|uniref:PRC-barrel domain-containing protein n=1 Tax=Phototrophicus methaneseepsis TaxID=2710758 RepID=A0A7S8IGF2_9CHLR|nr:PRC-barrel domain-containing protein [Phototrophicus methaneseepsis]QPC84691.1 PRC-barrel domain-containing protein [Phototrophicus methaneseepsis]